MPRIFIENQPYNVPEGKNVLHVCLSLGFNLPYFCWHPGMHSVGACRQCAVKQYKNEEDREGRLVMACMLHATDETRISIADPDAAGFRAAVIELLMTNHPHDCPVCDEGGECHLQDMTVMTGHNYRRFRFGKRTHVNQYLGPFINHEMNRCIACYRCLRFYREYAGGRDLHVFQTRNDVYFGRHEDGVLESEFSGNLVEVCPTGVFTDKTLKEHYARKWDLQTAPSVCVHCSVGCNTIPGERYGTLRRISNRYNSQVNSYWLCDRGRFGYEFVNDGRRERHTLAREQGVLQRVPRELALGRVAQWLQDRERVVGIGSPRASLEANFALRALVGPERFCCGMSEQDRGMIATILEILREGPVRTPSLAEMCDADATLILGEDISNTAPLMALAVRQAALRKEIGIAKKLHIPAWHDAAVREAIQLDRGPVYIASVTATRLDDLATDLFRGAPDDIARLGFAVAHAIHDHAPNADGADDALRLLATSIAADLLGAQRPLIISGGSLESETILHAAANIAWALRAVGKEPALTYTAPECNSLGMGLVGGCSAKAACDDLLTGKVDTAVVLENDLFRRSDNTTLHDVLQAVEHVVVIDHIMHETAARASVFLPAATFAEGDGTMVNYEGRAQRYYQVFVAGGDVQESWRWLRDIAIRAGHAEAAQWHALDDITTAISHSRPVFASLPSVSAPARFRIAGEKIARQPQRYSGRTAMHADVQVAEPTTPPDPDSPLAYSMEGYQGQPPSSLVPRYWAPGWNSVQALNKFQEEVGGPLRGGDPGQRLIEPAEGPPRPYFHDIPEGFTPRDGMWLVAPLHHVFGSEELSSLSPGIAELAPTPYVAVTTSDAERLGVLEGDELDISGQHISERLPVRIVPELVRGIAGIPAGLCHLSSARLPGWFALRKVAAS